MEENRRKGERGTVVDIYKYIYIIILINKKIKKDEIMIIAKVTRF